MSSNDPLYSIILSFSNILMMYDSTAKSAVETDANDQNIYLIQLINHFKSNLPSNLITIALSTGKQIQNELDKSLESFDEIASSTNDNNLIDELQLLSEVLFDIRKHWRLAEICFLYSSQSIGFEFIKWLQANVIDLSSDKVSVLLSNESNNNTSLSDTADLILSQAMKGYLSDVWSIIRLDPDIAEIIDNPSNGYYDSLVTVQEILLSHPFIEIINELTDEIDSTYLSNLSTLSSKWKDKIFTLLRSKCRLLGRFPVISKLLLILSGDALTLADYSDDWLCLTLSQLLYVYSLPLSRSDIAAIIRGTTSDAMNDLDSSKQIMSFQSRVIESLNGNIAYSIRYIYELSYNYMSIPHLRLVVLTSAAQLAYYLFTSGASIPSMRSISLDQLTSLSEHPNESSFVEELLLEVAELLSQLNYPVDVILRYLTICPDRGIEFMRVLLDRRYISTDSETEDLSSVLKSFGLSDIARSVEIRRGTHYLSKCSTLRRIHGVGSWHHSLASSVVSASKSMYYYQLAGDLIRVSVLIEIVFVRLASAVKSSSEWFPDLTVEPIRPSPPMIPGSYWFKNNVYDPRITRVSTAGLLTRDDEYSELLYSLEEAEDMILCLDPSNSATIKSIQSLDRYARAIRLRLDVGSILDIVKAARLISNLITEELAPVRHWTHLLDLVCWFHRVKDSIANNDSDKIYGLVPKKDAYSLLNAYVTITSHIYTNRYLNGLSEYDFNNIRITLLDLLAYSVIQENIEEGEKRRLEQEKLDLAYLNRNKNADSPVYLSHLAKDESEAFVIADLLSGRALFNFSD